MFRRILVPLDGSKLSEASLPPARYLSEHLQSAIVLLHVVEKNPPQEVHKEPHLKDADQAAAYLRSLAESRFAPSTEVSTHVHAEPAEDVAQSIVDHSTREIGVDLIVTCTHGETGALRLLFGSIAQKVAAESRLPLLLIKPSSPTFKLERILLPLDPDSEHDMSLPVGEYLAARCGATLRLLSVVPTPATLAGEQAAAGNLMPATTQAFLDIKAENALEDLRTHERLLRDRGVSAEAVVVRGEPVAQILREAEARRVDLIVLSTHGRAGVRAFWARSVAPRVTERSTAPILLLPASSSP